MPTAVHHGHPACAAPCNGMGPTLGFLGPQPQFCVRLCNPSHTQEVEPGSTRHGGLQIQAAPPSRHPGGPWGAAAGTGRLRHAVQGHHDGVQPGLGGGGEAPQAQPRQGVSRLLGWGPGQGSFPPEPTPPHPLARHGRQSWEVPFCSLTPPSTGAGSHRPGAPWGSSGVQGGGRRAPVPQHLGREYGLPVSTRAPWAEV